MPEWISAVIPPAIAVAVIGLIGTAISMAVTRQTAKETNHIASLAKANESWESFSGKLEHRVGELAQQVACLTKDNQQMRSEMREIKDDLHKTQGVLSDSLDLNLEFLRWVDDGALPPPPQVKTDRLKRRIEHLQ